jgi:hypothetical protein
MSTKEPLIDCITIVLQAGYIVASSCYQTAYLATTCKVRFVIINRVQIVVKFILKNMI